MLKIVTTAATVLAAGVAARAYGAWRWRAGTREMRDRLQAARAPLAVSSVDFRELEGLPAAVQRYFRGVLREGRPLVAGARLRQRGSFNSGAAADRWRPFTAEQRVIARRPGFDWDARIRMMPGLPVFVHDAYVAGEGILQAAVLGLFPVAKLRDHGAIAEGELMRFLAEAPWYPTALLPSQGVRWEAVDGRSARATLSDGAVSATLLFVFDAQGYVRGVRAEGRARIVGGNIVRTPWQASLWDHAERGGMLVPLQGEVAWLLPEGAKPYWRGELIGVDYEFVGA